VGAALIGRRSLLIAGASAAAASLIARDALPMGRVPLGGKLSMQLPHDTSRVDPHDLTDPMAALVGPALFDTLFALDAHGTPYAALAEGMPVRDGRVTRVMLREGLRSSRGHPIEARDLTISLERARRMGAVAVLAEVPVPTLDKGAPRAALFRDVDPAVLVQALCSPVTALVSRHFAPGSPDGTGAFKADPSADRLLLTRNRYASRGASFLEEVSIRRAADLIDPIRAFEAQSIDVGWLGSYVHQPRPGAVAFDLGSVAWVVLRTGNEAGEWGAPGVAQRLCDAIPPSRLAHLALGRLPTPSGTPSWGGPVCDLIVSSASAHLVEIARTLASILSLPGHEITAVPTAPGDLLQRRKSGGYALMLDLVRPVGPAGVATLIALATADQGAGARSIARHPPRLTSFAPRVLARTMRLGVVGELRVAGAAIGALRLAAARDGNGWDLGASWRVPAP